MKFHRALGLGMIVSGIVTAGGLEAADLSWSNTGAGTHDWMTGTNWAGGNPPDSPETDRIVIRPTTSSSPQTVRFNVSGTQTLQGGMLLNPNGSNSPLTLNLDQNTLIFDGGALEIFRENSTALNSSLTISNGRVQLGTEANAAEFLVGLNSVYNSTMPNMKWVVFDSTAILDTKNLSAFTLVTGDDRVQSLGLDLSAATLADGKLAVNGNLRVVYKGAGLVSSPRTWIGLLKLPTAGDYAVEVGGNLEVAVNLKQPHASNGIIGTAQASLDLGGGEEASIEVGGSLILGHGDRATAAVVNLPDALDLSVGSESVRGGVIYAGYKDRSQGTTGSNSDGDTSGTLVSAGGTFAAYATDLRVGQNTRAGGSATGVLDFSAAELSVLDVSGDAFIGVGVEAVGMLLLRDGAATVANLTLGDSTAETDSVLGLNGTLFEVRESLSLGSLGQVNVTVGADSAGLDLLSSDPLDFTLASGAQILVTFTGAAGGEDIWGLRMAGADVEQLNLLQGYLSDGRLVATGLFGGQAVLFQDGAHTYFGLQAIPEPGTVLLLAAGGLLIALFGPRLRKN